MRWIGMAGAIVLLVAGFVALGLTSDFVVDWLWFSAVGYREVFWTVFTAKASLFSAVFVASTIPVWVSGTLALRYARQRGPWLPVVLGRPSKPVRTWSEVAPEPIVQKFPQLPWRWIIAGIAVVIGVLIAEAETAKWDLVLRFLHQVPYGQRDPLFGKDIGFYLFSLPALRRAQELDAAGPRPERLSSPARYIGRTATSNSPRDANGYRPQP